MAVDRRRKDINWTPADENGSMPTWERIGIAVLLDIRDELQTLNRLLACSNCVGIPHTLKRIDRRLSTTRKLTKGKR